MPSRYAVSALITLLLCLSTQVEAADWWARLFHRTAQPENSEVSKAVAEALTVAVEDLEGSTGGSVTRALRQQLREMDGVHYVELPEAARFVISGSSVSGRISAKLTERKGKDLFERTYASPGIWDNVRILADDVVFVMTGRLGLTTSQLVFVADSSGKKQIYLVDADGKNLEQLTRDPVAAVSPALSPDGMKMVYTSYSSGLPSLMLLDMSAGMERVAAHAPGCNSGAVFSPDGRELALGMSFLGNPEVFALDISTAHAICLTESTGVPCSPAWHPEGRLVVFSTQEGADSALYVVDKESTASAQRWATGMSFHADPDWSPDGGSIAFTTRVAGNWAVAVKGYPDGRTEILQRGGAQHPSWSPDGQSIAYVQGSQLWVHDLKSKRRRSIVSGRGTVSEPRWIR
jgi:TolB protein